MFSSLAGQQWSSDVSTPCCFQYTCLRYGCLVSQSRLKHSFGYSDGSSMKECDHLMVPSGSEIFRTFSLSHFPSYVGNYSEFLLFATIHPPGFISICNIFITHLSLRAPSINSSRDNCPSPFSSTN